MEETGNELDQTCNDVLNDVPKVDIPNADNWIHRSTNMKCRTCMYFVLKVGDMPIGSSLGRCRRHCPTMSGFPAVFNNDWCGDHKLDENKA